MFKTTSIERIVVVSEVDLMHIPFKEWPLKAQELAREVLIDNKKRDAFLEIANLGRKKAYLVQQVEILQELILEIENL